MLPPGMTQSLAESIDFRVVPPLSLSPFSLFVLLLLSTGIKRADELVLYIDARCPSVELGRLFGGLRDTMSLEFLSTIYSTV